MTKELQDLAWSILPKEFKEEVRTIYAAILRMVDKREDAEQVYVNKLSTLEGIFGFDNLTSDAEGEEMLTVPRKDIIELYQEVQKTISQCKGTELAIQAIGIKNVIWSFFGSKCLPDETPLSQKSPENCDNGNHISNDCDKSAEPKYHRGEKVCYNGYVYEVEGLVGKNRYALKGLNFDLDEDMIEPYTEPEGKLGMDARGWFRTGTAANGNPIKVRIPSGEVDPYTSPAPINFDEIERFDRNYRRLNIAAMMMQGLLANPNNNANLSETVADALNCADALLHEVEKGGLQ